MAASCSGEIKNKLSLFRTLEPVKHQVSGFHKAKRSIVKLHERQGSSLTLKGLGHAILGNFV